MSDHPTCGLWPARDRIAASVFDGDGPLHRIWMVPEGEGEIWDCLYYLERDYGLDLHLVVPETAPPLEPVVRAALLRQTPVLVVPTSLVQAIVTAALARPRPRHYASVLARLPGSRFHSHLRKLPPKNPRQMMLL